MRSIGLTRRGGLALALASSLLVAGSEAQTREELIRQAQQDYEDFETQRALENLRTALDPARGVGDSLWANAVHLLAQIYVEEGNASAARAWLRWAMRLDPAMAVDGALFLPEVLDASREARAFVAGTASAGDALVETTWEWPRGPSRGASGQIRIAPSALAAPLRALLAGRAVSEGGTAALDAGSYEIQAAASGYRTVSVQREVLPDVTTVLRFRLEPLVVAEAPPAPAPPAPAPPPQPEGVSARAREQLVKLEVGRFGAPPQCRVGFVVGATYLATTYDAIRGADSVAARFADGAVTARGIRVAAYDTEANVAILKLPTARPDSLVVGTDLSADSVWSLTYQDCAPAIGPTATRASVVEAGPTTVRVSPPAPGGFYGGALIDRSGAVQGLVRQPDLAVRGSALLAVLREARRRDPGRLVALADVARAEGVAPPVTAPVAPAPAVEQERRGGGFPVAIVVGGLAAAGAGVAALLLAGGGQQDERCPAGTTGTPPNCTPTSSTGSMTFSIPNR